MKTIYLIVVLGLVFALYVVRACDPAEKNAAVEAATATQSLDQCVEENKRISEAWEEDAEALVRCWNKNCKGVDGD